MLNNEMHSLIGWEVFSWALLQKLASPAPEIPNIGARRSEIGEYQIESKSSMPMNTPRPLSWKSLRTAARASVMALSDSAMTRPSRFESSSVSG